MLLSLSTILTTLACLLVFGAAWRYRRRRLSATSLRADEPSVAFCVGVLGLALTGMALLAVSIHS
jgi:hypothetical protein